MQDDNQIQDTNAQPVDTQITETPIVAPIEQTIPITDSIPTDVPPVTPEASLNSFVMSPNKDQNEAVIPDLDESSSEAEQEPSQNEAQNEPISEPTQAIETENPATLPSQTPQTSTFESLTSNNHMSELLEKEHIAIENKRGKKLDGIMTLFVKQTNITNDEVEKFLHVSNATATRYLSILKKENKIIQNGKTGKSVYYTQVK